MTNQLGFVRVVKVGGSLLDWPELPSALENWLNHQPLALNILICGCGKLGDAIRQADQVHALGEEVCHWLCVDLTAVAARLLSVMLSDLALIERYEHLQKLVAQRKAGNIIFSPQQFLREHEAALPGFLLPHNWSVTTDSIAARLAAVLNADELIILKSTPPPSTDRAELARLGYVDAAFSTAAQRLSAVRFIDLRVSPSQQLTIDH